MDKRTCRKDLEDAAGAISSDTLIKARTAIEIDCREFIRWSGVLMESLDNKVKSLDDARRFARALALYQLGYLPAKPGTCPFCIQYSADRSCAGCGYASTHGGRCDLDTSAFNQFIEALHELGRVIYQDNSNPYTDSEENGSESIDVEEAKRMLRCSIEGSSQAACNLIKDLDGASSLRFMEIKADYLYTLLKIIPEFLLSKDAKNALYRVRETLSIYW